MYTRFPFSMEKIPKPKSFVCLSLKFGSIFSGLTIILYTVFALAQCLSSVTTQATGRYWDLIIIYGYLVVVIIGNLITLFLSTVMLIGVLRERYELIKPWVIWVSMQVMMLIMMFVLWSTMSVINNFRDMSLISYVTEFLLLLCRAYMLMLVGGYCEQLEREQDDRRKSLINEDSWTV